MKDPTGPLKIYRRRAIWTSLMIMAVGGLMPILATAMINGGIPSLSPAGARALLGNPSNNAALVDVNSSERFDSEHVQGAYSEPLENMMVWQGGEGNLPGALRGKTLIVIDDGGFESALAGRRLMELGHAVMRVEGGLPEWKRDGPRLGVPRPELSQQPYTNIVDSLGNPVPTYHSIPVMEQTLAAAGLLLIKPIYTLLGALLIFLLLRYDEKILRVTGWGVAIFWVGELACGINYFLLGDASILAEYIHSFSMVLTFAFMSYCLLEIVDERVLHFSAAQKNCRLLGLCETCVKTADGEISGRNCAIKRMGLAVLPVGALLSLIPLMTPFSPTSYNASVGPIVQFFTRTTIQQIFEARYCPLAAAVLFGAAWVALVFSRQENLPVIVRLLGCAAIGFMGFSFFRCGLGLMYNGHLAMADFWEEATELLFILGVFYLLWVFRRGFSIPIHLPGSW